VGKIMPRSSPQQEGPTEGLLPCPQCGSTKTLSQLRAKRERVKLRLSEGERERNTPTQPPSCKTRILPEQIHGFGEGHMTLAPYNPLSSCVGDLTIAAPGITGTVLINEAVLDVCLGCGSFYAANARVLEDQIETEIVKMDPLGALAEIRGPDEAVSG